MLRPSGEMKEFRREGTGVGSGTEWEFRKSANPAGELSAFAPFANRKEA
jgi:hypothetical protein